MNSTNGETQDTVLLLAGAVPHSDERAAGVQKFGEVLAGAARPAQRRARSRCREALDCRRAARAPFPQEGATANHSQAAHHSGARGARKGVSCEL